MPYKDKEKQKQCDARWRRNHRKIIRKLALETLGGKCIKCGFSDSRALQVDHINGGGKKEFKNLKNESFYKKVIENFLNKENK